VRRCRPLWAGTVRFVAGDALGDAPWLSRAIRSTRAAISMLVGGRLVRFGQGRFFSPGGGGTAGVPGVTSRCAQAFWAGAGSARPAPRDLPSPARAAGWCGAAPRPRGRTISSSTSLAAGDRPGAERGEDQVEQTTLPRAPTGRLRPPGEGFRRAGEPRTARSCAHASKHAAGRSSGDHLEGQFEGQNTAGEGLPEPVPACVGYRTACSSDIWPGQEAAELFMACKRSGVRIPIAPPGGLHTSPAFMFTFGSDSLAASA
jgi:hypothetical protein